MQKLTKNKQLNNEQAETWYLIDAKGVRLGQLASEVSKLLLDKTNPGQTEYQTSNNHIVITNTDLVDYHFKREKNKMYYRHSGYPGGFKQRNLGEQMKLDSRKVVENAISGMLPKNKLRDRYMTQVRIYKDEYHNQEAQKPKTIKISRKMDNK
ncbi:MAG: 50S ribosomal protein L13 [Candidatus Dojkabacteria bacterium]